MSRPLLPLIIALIGGFPFWPQIAFWLIAAGIIGRLATAVFGLIDWLDIPAYTRAKRIGLRHGGGNLLVPSCLQEAGDRDILLRELLKVPQWHLPSTA